MLAVLAGTMLIPAVADLAHGHRDWKVFGVTAGVTAFFGGGTILASRQPHWSMDLRQAFLLTTLSWVVIAAFGALPFAFATLNLTYTDAFFETMSGLTTTGSTVIVGLDQAPPGILLWRSLLHWIGGLGIVAIAVALLPMLRIGGMQLFRLESSDKSEKALPRARQIATGIGAIYVGLTAVCALAYWTGGMTGFEAVNHAMATLATGGFSTSDSSFMKFDSAFLDATGTLFMLIGGMTFTLFLRASAGEWRPLWRDGQTHWYLATWLWTSLALFAWLVLHEDKTVGFALRHATFTVSSIQTTTGFASTDYATWGSFAHVVFFILTFVGACSGSTAGGIKIFRFQILAETVRAQLRHSIYPAGVFVARYNRKPISDEVAQSVLSFIALYVGTWAASALALGACGLDLVTATTAAATTLGNVGPGLGEIIGPTGNFASLPPAAKWICSVTMLLGRLELVTVFVLLSRRFWRA